MKSLKNNFNGNLNSDMDFFEREVILAKDVELVKIAASNMNMENDKVRLAKIDLELEKFVDSSEKNFLIE